MGAERRRDRRYRFQMPGEIVRRQGPTPVLTGDVGYRGALLRTDAPPPLRQLLLLRFELLPDGERIELHAMAVWNVPPGSGSRSPGVGVQFYAVPPETRKRWNEFMRWVARSHPECREGVVTSAPGAVDPVRRLHERVDVSLEVRVREPAGVEKLSTRYVSRRGMFLWKSPPWKPGTPLDLEFLHPSTSAILKLPAIVRFVSEEAGRPGVGAEFVGIGEQTRDEIMSFVAAAPDRSRPEEPIFVNPGDPLLASPTPDEDLFSDVDFSTP